MAAYEAYRAALTKDPDAVANVATAEESNCILLEDRWFLLRVSNYWGALHRSGRGIAADSPLATQKGLPKSAALKKRSG